MGYAPCLFKNGISFYGGPRNETILHVPGNISNTYPSKVSDFKFKKQLSKQRNIVIIVSYRGRPWLSG